VPSVSFYFIEPDFGITVRKRVTILGAITTITPRLSHIAHTPSFCVRRILYVLTAICGFSLLAHRAVAQELPLITHADSLKLKSVVKPDTMLPTRTTPAGEYFRRPSAERTGSAITVSREAIRYYASPSTVPLLLEEIGGPYALLPTEAGYERESFTLTNRTSEGLTSSLINGSLPIDDPITGNTELNMFSVDGFERISLGGGATALSKTSADLAASDMLDMEVERFRAPVPYSRVHYTQALSQSLSNFEGLFSLNASRGTNLTFGIDRRAAGNSPNVNDPTFNPRVDLWSGRVQMTYNSFLGTIHRDSTTTQHVVDSILSTPYALQHSLDFLIWGNYTSAFSGLSGGISPADSTTDIFNAQLAPTIDRSTSEHRIRLDGLAQIDLPFIATLRTRISAYATYSARRLLTVDSGFSPYTLPLTEANRFGLSLEQPLGVHLGDFLTEARLKGEIQSMNRSAISLYSSAEHDLRFAATASDSIGIQGNFGINLFGFVRAVQDNLTLGSDPVSSLFLPSVGLEGSIKLTQALGFDVSYTYQKDRAVFSPTPSANYQIRNIGAFLDLRFGAGFHDSVALHAGVLDRHEPEGVVLDFLADSLQAVRFSNQDLHTQSAQVALDLYFGHFHFSGLLTYYPTTNPITPPSPNPLIAVPLNQKLFGNAGFYYESEVGEGNLRLSLGGRLRFLNRLDPQLTYDPASDYYLYKGAAARAGKPLADPRITTAKGIFDVLISTEIDRRAQVNMGFLNILSAPYYNVSVYPRQGFEWRIDVTWAFLD